MEKRMAPSVEPEDRARKRRKQSAPKNDDKAALVAEDAQRLLDLILRRKDRTRLIHKEFKTLPDRGSYPDYYEEISDPIALEDIQNKLANNEYSSLDAVKKDLILMCENAKIYNEAKSQIYKDANVLRKIVDEFEGTEPQKLPVTMNGRTPHKRATAAAVTEPAPIPKPEEAMLRIIDGLLNAVDPMTGETMFEDFRNLVSRKEYPEYYQVIKEAMSLNTIRKRILAHKYSGWSDFERDLNLVVTNAEEFNEEGSEIVALARKLRARFEAALLRERGPVDKTDKPAQSGIKLKLNMKQEASATPTPAPKLKLTLRNPPRGSPDAPQAVPASQQAASNGYMSSTPQPNGITNSRSTSIPQNASPTKNSQPHASQQQSPIPTPPIVEPPPQEIKSEPNGLATRNRRSPGSTPKPTKILPVRKSRTPAALPEADSITVVPRTNQSPTTAPAAHLSPPVQATPIAETTGPTGVPPNKTPTPGPGEIRSTMSPAAQSATLAGQNTGYSMANGVDPRFRPPGKGVEDALIANLTCATHPNLNIANPVEHSFPADQTKSFQNHVVFFEAQHSVLLILLTLGATVQGRPYTASITVNGHRLYFNNMQPNPNRRKDDYSTLSCDVRLVPGRVTHVEVTVIAGQKGAKAGMGEQEQEKFTVDAFLQYE